MKKATVLLVLLLALGATGNASGQVKVFVDGGLGVPTGDFGDGWKTGFAGGFGLGYEAARGFELSGRFHYNKFGLSEDGETAMAFLMVLAAGGTLSDLPYVTVDGGDAQLLEFMTEGKYLFPTKSSFKPHVIVGLGLVNVSISDIDGLYNRPGFQTAVITLESDSETKVAMNFGAGAEITISPRANLFFEGKYLTIFTEDEATSVIPLRAGVNFMLGR